MKTILSEGDVARFLKVSEETVCQLFDEGVLSGNRIEGAWQTTEQLLEADVTILTEQARMQRLIDGEYISPWETILAQKGSDSPVFKLDSLESILTMFER